MFKLTSFNSPVRRNDNFVDALFDDLFELPSTRVKNWSFKLDVKEEGDNYLIEADLPGIKKEEVKINYEDQTLVIAVERKDEKEEKNDSYIHRERSYSSMQRALHLPNIDPQKIKAKLDEGVLKLTVEKKAIDKSGHIIEIE